MKIVSVNKKNFILSFICGFLAGTFLVPILFNPTIGEFDYVRKYLMGKEFFLLFLPILFGICFTFGIFVAYYFKSRFPILFQFAKFGEVGVLNTFLDIGVLNFLSGKLGITQGIFLGFLNSISFLLAATNSYFWNKIWTFEKEKKFNFREFRLFVLISFIGLLINTGVVILGTFLLKNTKISAGGILNLVKILATLLAMLWNFLGYKIFVFK